MVPCCHYCGNTSCTSIKLWQIFPYGGHLEYRHSPLTPDGRNSHLPLALPPPLTPDANLNRMQQAATTAKSINHPFPLTAGGGGCCYFFFSFPINFVLPLRQWKEQKGFRVQMMRDQKNKHVCPNIPSGAGICVCVWWLVLKRQRGWWRWKRNAFFGLGDQEKKQLRTYISCSTEK